MGVSRSKSTREKTKSRKVPDPYAIDSDDLVMVDGPEDSAKDMKVDTPEKERRPRKSRRESTMMSGGLGGGEAVMVDAPRDDLVDDARPPLVRRATSSAKKPGLMGGIFSAFTKGTPDRRQGKPYDSDDGLQRKRGSVYDDDRAKRLRRDDRKVGRSRKPSDADGLTDGARGVEPEDADAKAARRADRRAQRDEPDDEARVERRRQREEARQAKAREEDDKLKQEEEDREARRNARRADRDARRAEEDRLAQEEEAKTAERRERRREKERSRAEEETSSRPKTGDRRRSHMDAGEEDPEARRIRREERRVRRSVDPVAEEKERPRTSRRRTDVPAPVDDYFDKRNGEQASYAPTTAPPADGRPYIKSGGDKTTSWVDSVNESPPPPPPIEGTIIDAPVHFAHDDAPDALDEDELTAREYRHKRAKDRDGYGSQDPEVRGSRHDRLKSDGVRSSDGSSYDRRRDYGGPVNSMGFNDMGRPTMPTGASKRSSWFKKIAGI